MRRLHAILDTLASSCAGRDVLAAGVLAIVGNTIRLDIKGRRAEIKVTKLLGGNDAFVRRPFLYTGFWYGLLGGSVAFSPLVLGAGLLLVSAVPWTASPPSGTGGGIDGFSASPPGHGPALVICGFFLRLGGRLGRRCPAPVSRPSSPACSLLFNNEINRALRRGTGAGSSHSNSPSARISSLEVPDDS